MTTVETKMHVRVEIESVWMNLENPEMSVPEGVAILKSLGNVVLEVDEPGRRFRVQHKGGK